MNLSGTRRTFLRSAAWMAAAGCVPGLHTERMEAAQTAGSQTSPIRFGLASYTLRNFSRAEVIADMKQLRLTDINCKDVKDHLPSTSVAEERAAVDEYKAAGIRVTAVGTIYFPKDEDDDIREKFEYAKRAGASVIVAGDPAPDVLPRIERFVKQYDIRLAIHNHGPEDKIWHSPMDVLKVVKNMDPRIGCCVDVGHSMRAGDDVVQVIKAVGPRLFDMHIKDLANATEKESQVAVGQGLMPVKAIFQQLIAMQYKGFVDLEYEINGDHPMPGVIESFAYMRGVLAGMGAKA